MSRGIVVSRDGRDERIVVPGVQLTRQFTAVLTPDDADSVAVAMSAAEGGETWWQFAPEDRVSLVYLCMALHVTAGSWSAGDVTVRLESGNGDADGLPFVALAPVPTGLQVGATFSPPLSAGEPGLRASQRFGLVAPRNVELPVGPVPLLRAVLDVAAGFDPTSLLVAVTIGVDID